MAGDMALRFNHGCTEAEVVRDGLFLKSLQNVSVLSLYAILEHLCLDKCAQWWVLKRSLVGWKFSNNATVGIFDV